MGVSQSTVSRRIQGLEDSIGAKLFIRRYDGIVPTDVGRRILEASSELETVSRRLALISSGLNRDATIVISGSDGVVGYWLPILLSEFPAENPGISLRVQCKDVVRGSDVSSADTDVEITYFPPDEHDVFVLGKGSMPLRMFASQSYIERYGMPESLEEVADHRACIVDAFRTPGVGVGDWDRYAAILANHKHVAYEVNSALALGFAIRSGWGIGVQPALVADTEPGMVMLPEEVYLSSIVFWLVAHKDVKDNPAPRLLARWIKDRIIRSFKNGHAVFEIPGEPQSHLEPA